MWTYSDVEDGTDGFVVTDEEGGVAPIATQLHPVATVQDAVTPRWGSMLLTETKQTLILTHTHHIYHTRMHTHMHTHTHTHQLRSSH